MDVSGLAEIIQYLGIEWSLDQLMASTAVSEILPTVIKIRNLCKISLIYLPHFYNFKTFPNRRDMPNQVISISTVSKLIPIQKSRRAKLEYLLHFCNFKIQYQLNCETKSKYLHHLQSFKTHPNSKDLEDQINLIHYIACQRRAPSSTCSHHLHQFSETNHWDISARPDYESEVNYMAKVTGHGIRRRQIRKWEVYLCTSLVTLTVGLGVPLFFLQHWKRKIIEPILGKLIVFWEDSRHCGD